MSSMLSVARLELRRLLVRPLAWVLAALTLAQLAWRFVMLLGNFLENQVKLAALPGGPGYTDLVAIPLLGSTLTLGILPFGLAELALLIVPLLTMSSLAGDRANGTLPLFAASGTSPAAIVLGKYLAVLLWLLGWLALTVAMPLSLAHGTQLDWGKFAAAVLGLALMLAALGAVGVACSAFTASPVVAATVSLSVGLVLFMLNLAALSMGISNGFWNWLALSTHVEMLLRGLVSSADLVWFALVAAVALTLAIHRLSTDKERG